MSDPQGGTGADRPPLRWSYEGDVPPATLSAVRIFWRTRGPLWLARQGFRFAGAPFLRLRHRIRPRYFRFQGRDYPYFLHPYNRTWSNERAVEIPIARAEMEAVKAAGGTVLEIGHVLGHYGATGHPVVDQYERAPGVHNVDIDDFPDARRFDLIVSISTLEHVGWDETPVAPGKLATVLGRLTQRLAPGGRLLATLPLGYNPHLDAQLAARELPFAHLAGLRRTGLLTWREAAWQEIAGLPYAGRWPGASAVVIAWLER